MCTNACFSFVRERLQCDATRNTTFGFTCCRTHTHACLFLFLDNDLIHQPRPANIPYLDRLPRDNETTRHGEIPKIATMVIAWYVCCDLYSTHFSRLFIKQRLRFNGAAPDPLRSVSHLWLTCADIGERLSTTSSSTVVRLEYIIHPKSVEFNDRIYNALKYDSIISIERPLGKCHTIPGSNHICMHTRITLHKQRIVNPLTYANSDDVFITHSPS